MRGEPKLDEQPAGRIVLEELAHEPARRALDEADEHGVAAALVIGRVEVEPNVVAGLRVEIEGARVRVALGTRLQRPAGQARQEADEGGRAAERDARTHLLDQRVMADAAALPAPLDVLALDRTPHAVALSHHALDERRQWT